MTRVTRGVLGAALLALLAALVLTACGGGGSSSDSTTTATESTEQAENTEDASANEGGSAAASKKVIAPYVGHPSPFPVTAKLEEVPEGGSFLYVNCGNAVCALLNELLEGAGATMGVPLEQVKAGYTASEAQSAFQTVVQKEPLATIRVQGFVIGRYVVAVGAATTGFATFAAQSGLISHENAVQVASSINDIETGAKLIWNGLSNLYVVGGIFIAALMAAWGMLSSSPKHAATIAADCLPDTKIVTTPQIAAATPNQPNIVSNESHTVVQGLS